MPELNNSETLDTLCNFTNGGAWSESEYEDNGVPVLKVSNFKNNEYSLNDVSYLSKKGAEKYSRHLVQIDDLVIATVGSHPNLVNSAAGRTIAITKEVEGYLLNQNAVFLRTKDPKKLNQKYLTYLGEAENFRHYIQVRGKGAASQMRIAIGDIKSFSVKLLALHQQIKIASVLSAYDDIIENNLKRIKLLEEKAQITYEEWFVRMKFPGHEEVDLDSITGLPEGWICSNIGRYFGSAIGGGWGEDELSNEFCEPAYVIRGTDFNRLTKGEITNVPFRYHKKSNLASRKLQEGDIIFEISGGSHSEGVAKTAVITPELLSLFDNSVMCASFCKLARPAESKYSFYLFHFLRFLRKIKGTEVFEIRSASNIVNYNWTAFLKFQELDIPSEELLNKFNLLMQNIHKQSSQFGMQNQLLKEARSILLPRLMTGMIDIDKVEMPQVLLDRISVENDKK